MLKSFFEKVDYFWFFLFVTVFLCFGFFLTNPVMGIDDEIIETYTSFGSHLFLNRIGKIISNFLVGREFVPLAYDFLCVALYVISIVIIVDIFQKKIVSFSKVETTIFAVYSISFPFFAFLCIFFDISADFGLAILSASCSAVLFCYNILDENSVKFRKYSFLICLLLMFSVSIYEISVLYFLFVPLCISFYALVVDNKKYNNTFLLKQIFYSFVFVIIAVILYRVIIYVIQFSLLGIVYDRYNDYAGYSFSSLSSFLNSVVTSFSQFIDIFSNNLLKVYSCKVVLFSIITLLFISCVFSIVRRNYLIIFLGFIIVFLPISPFLLTGQAYMPYRVFSSYALVNAMTLVILYKFLQRNIWFSRIFIFMFIFSIFAQIKEINSIFYTEYLKFENDKLFANSIDYDLKRLGYDKYPVIFVGVRKKLDLPYSFEGIANEINASTFNWDRAFSIEEELTSKRPYKFMQKLGYDIYPYLSVSQSDELITKEEKAEILQQYEDKLKSIVPTLEIYPRENSIKKVDDFVLVKIGHSYFDK